MAIEGRDFKPIHYRSISSAYRRAANRVMQLQGMLSEDMRASKGMVVLFTDVQSL